MNDPVELTEDDILKEISENGLVKQLTEEEKKKLDSNENPVYIGLGIADYS